jgi:hypothetical protein
MDPILSGLSLRLHRFLEASLANDLLSTDAELQSHYLTQGLTLSQANQALRYRDLYIHFMFFEGHTPILKGYEALLLINGSMQCLRDFLKSLSESDQRILQKCCEVLECHEQTNAATRDARQRYS